MKLKAILPSSLSSEIISGNIQQLGLVRILDYTLNDIPTKNDKYLIVTKCEAISPALEAEYIAGGKTEGANVKMKVKSEELGVFLKPKQEIQTKSAHQIVHEQSRNMAPAARMAMTRRVHPLVSLNPYQGNWTIKVQVTSKGNMRTYKNFRGEGCLFSVELTDEDGTEIRATMFNEAAKKFYDKFELGKVYYISKGTLKVANKQFNSVKNDYEMTLNEYSEVEKVSNEAAFIPETKFNFVPIDELGPYVNGRELVDVIGVVQSVSPTMSIQRKSNSETIPKCDLTIADETKKTVVVSLWNELATNVGQELLDVADKSPVVAIKSLKVGDFQGISLSTLSRSVVVINPEVPEAKKLRNWFDSEGKETSLASAGAGLSPTTRTGSQSMYQERVFLSHIVGNPSLGQEKPEFFNVKAYVSYITPDQAMWYRACKTCDRKVTEAIGSGYWCESCQKNDDQYNLRHIPEAPKLPSKIASSSAAPTHASQSSGSNTDADQDRPWNRPPKRKRTLENDTLSSCFLRGVPGFTMPFQDLVAHLNAFEVPQNLEEVAPYGDENMQNEDVVDLCESDGDTGQSPYFVPSSVSDHVIEPVKQATTNALTSFHEKVKSSKESPAVAVSEFHGANLIRESHFYFLQFLWKRVTDKISHTSIDSIFSIEGEVDVILAEMKKMTSIDIAHVEAMFYDLFGKARQYDSLRSKTNDMMTQDAYLASLSSAKAQLGDITANEEVETAQLTTLTAELNTIEEKQKVLEMQLRDLEKQKKHVQSSMEHSQEKVKKIQTEAVSKKKEISAIEGTSFQSEEVMQDLEQTKSVLEASLAELVNYKFML